MTLVTDRVRLWLLSTLLFSVCLPLSAQSAPQITAVTPTTATAGTQVTIAGTGFGATQGSGNVWLGSTYGVVVSWSDTQIVATVASGSSSGVAQVLQDGVWGNQVAFTVVTPTISGISPSAGGPGTQITVNGTGFGATQGSGEVWLGSKDGVVVSWSDTQIVATVGSGSGNGVAQVRQGGVWSNQVALTTQPRIASVTPTTGVAGTQVTLTGSLFGATQGSGNVWLGSTYGVVVSWSDTQIVATVASGSSSGVAQVLQNGVWGNAVGFTITTAPTLVSIRVMPPSSSITLNAVQQLRLAAIGTYSDNSTQDLTTSATWSTSDTSVALVLTGPGAQGVVAPVAAGTVTITASLGNLSSTASVTVTAPPAPVVPNIASVSPTSGVAGTQVTVTGTGFGSAQGTGSIWLGSTLGVVATWSDTQIVAAVAPGSTSGIVQVTQAGQQSNALSFNVSTATIAGVTPGSGLPGTQVTIAGSGFGAAQGNGQVWLGSAPGLVSSWSDTQVVATVATGSTSGTAQVLQNGVWSNAVTFTVNTPQIAGVTPSSGAPGTAVTIAGSGFGASQGSGTVWIGSAPGLVSSWSDTQVVATVADGSVTGIVRIQQNGVWSNALSFAVPPSDPSQPSLTITPSLISMVVGDTRTLQVLDPNGQEVTGLTWTTSDSTIATLSTDDPPVITAVAPGHVTIKAGNASADVTIYAGPLLPAGTVVWKNPGDGSGVASIIPAVPSSSGVADVFASQASGLVQAVKVDGTVAWGRNVGSGKRLIPDFQGGLLITDGVTLQKLDGLTGQPAPAYAFVHPDPYGFSPPPVLVHPDSTVFTVDGDMVVLIDPSTGKPKFQYQLEDSVDSINGNCGEFPRSESSFQPVVGEPIIAGDGFTYIPYVYTRSPLASNDKICNSDGEVITSHTDTHLRVLRLTTDGTAKEIPLGDWAQDGVTQCVLGPPYSGSGECGGGHWVSASSGAVPDGNELLGSLITNADQGAMYSWTLSFNGVPQAYNLTPLVGGDAGNAVPLATPGPVQPVLQRADGTYIGTLLSPQGAAMIAFDQSGNLQWSTPGNYQPQIATADGGVTATTFSGSAVTFDQNGNATGELASLPTYSWTGNAYMLGSLDMVAASILHVGDSFWAFSQGNASSTATAAKEDFPPLASCSDPFFKPPLRCPGPWQLVQNAKGDLIHELIVNQACRSAATLYVFSKLLDANDVPLSADSFVRYLTGEAPRFYEGTQSSWPYANALCGPRSGFSGFVTQGVCRVQANSITIADQFASSDQPDAIAQTPSYPLLVFFRATTLDDTNDGVNPTNEAREFHEALHGITGFDDDHLASILLGQGAVGKPTDLISKYINDHVLSVCQPIFISH